MGREQIAGRMAIWLAVIAATGSIVAGILSRDGTDESAAANTAASCLVLIQGIRDWASKNPGDARLYLSKGTSDSRLPTLWSREERRSCGDHPERLIELNPPTQPRP
jgi:hypothetical protein